MLSAVHVTCRLVWLAGLKNGQLGKATVPISDRRPVN